MNNHDEKQVGSNLTGAAIPGKPGHQRDIPIPVDPNIEIGHEGKEDNKGDDLPTEHIQNTDALLGDVHPADYSENSQEKTNAKKENGKE
ncbi:hypothetical protein [Pedobacter ginsengisoli]|uniref:hypothetical protein n=1 Tax=Pedobacter ginsengisoli TaxID=363852 RepID=UPI00254DCF85|nr:hypothetical protein [Pedobacter ginsengisoli]